MQPSVEWVDGLKSLAPIRDTLAADGGPLLQSHTLSLSRSKLEFQSHGERPA